MRVTMAAIMMATAFSASGGEGGWVELFDGKTLDGWKASEQTDTWKVADGCLVARGGRSHLFYDGTVGNHDFRNFELDVEARTEPGANSGVFFHTQYRESGFPKKGYEVQINNTYAGVGEYRELKRTGSLYAVRNMAVSFVKDGEWFRMRVRVVGNRVRIHVNDYLMVDYLQPAEPARKADRAGRVLARGTIALQGHDEKSSASFRRVAIRLLPDEADASALARASDQGYGLTENRMDGICGADLPFIDHHIHLRGGMTVEKAMDRQAVTGINSGVLENLGTGWPIVTDEQLKAFIDNAAGKPVYVGVQVNDRDWHTKHAPELLKRLDYVLADTMIMAMPNDDSPPVKLWMPELYKIEDPEAWMERYMRHNLRVVSEPISILANPTYLPPAVKDLYDKLWTDERMKQLIQKAIDNHVALEFQAKSEFPKERFIRMAKAMGAKFSFGSNNFDDKPINMTRCLDAIEKYGLTKDDLFVPQRKR
jgi:histidinol phosphatase-like PHP family hydrolase